LKKILFNRSIVLIHILATTLVKIIMDSKSIPLVNLDQWSYFEVCGWVFLSGTIVDGAQSHPKYSFGTEIRVDQRQVVTIHYQDDDVSCVETSNTKYVLLKQCDADYIDRAEQQKLFGRFVRGVKQS